MAINSGDKVLLTGAGFTHNFGTPLASDIWYDIFNHPAVQSEQRVRTAVANDTNFESVYQTILTGAFTDQEKAAIVEAVAAAYDSLDETLRGYVFKGPGYVNIYGVQRLLARFRPQGGKGFIFTLNQDLFPERHYYNGPRPVLPGIQTGAYWFSSVFTDRLQQQNLVRVPTQEWIETNKQLVLSQEGFFLIKLHGSMNWRTAAGKPQMVIGGGKAQQIRAEPLLAWYSELFTQVLCQPNRALLIIGYGFGDEHINEVIADAVTQHQLHIHILSPEPFSNFKNSLNSKPHGQDLLSGVSGYHRHTLLEMFPGDQSVTEAFRKLELQFFESS